MTNQEHLVENVDFDAFYQGKQPVEGLDMSFDVAPWDIGGPQPAVVALADSGALGERVLDAGCGLGDNSIFLAECGYRVTGVDGAQTALDTARQRAADRGVRAEFARADVTTLDGVPTGFDTVLDSALYHCLSDRQRRDYAAALHRVTAPGAALHLFCFADEGNEGFPLPMSVSRDDLHTHLGEHWDIRDIRATDYATAFTPESFERHAPTFREQFGVDLDPAAFRVDDDGRILGRVWHARATRR